MTGQRVKPDGVAVTTVREDKLTDSAPKQPAPKQPLALALSAAAVTIVVILGVLAGPSVVGCFNSPDGMGQCLQGQMRAAGLLPGATPGSVDAAATAVEPVAPLVATEPEADTALVGPELDVEPAEAATAAAEAPENLVAASFGLLRAEPDGSVVIAGSGTPGSEIEIFANGMLLGRSAVAASGDWVFVPDIPIAPGGTEITLGETGKKGLAPESFVVAINADKTSEPLVVASTPGAASQVLQGLPQATADAPAQMAANTSSRPAAVAPPAAAALAVTGPAVTEPVETAVAATSSEAAPAAPVAAVSSADPAAPAAANDAVAAAADTAAAATAPAATEPTAPATGADQPATAETSQPVAAPTEPAVAVAATDPSPDATASAATPAPAMVATPTIDAVEVEGEKSFFAGSGPDGATVRLYVDDSFIADTIVSDGRWLIEAGKVLIKPNQRVRVDLLQAGSAEVVERAEVDFSLDLPAPATETAVAAADPAATPAPQPTEAAVPPTDTAAAEPAVPTMVGVSVGDIDDERFAAGKAIIRRGDNLWTIARRVYGEGIKYTAIYEANTGQIRDPDRIYPGQVFDLPDSANN